MPAWSKRVLNLLLVLLLAGAGIACFATCLDDHCDAPETANHCSEMGGCLCAGLALPPKPEIPLLVHAPLVQLPFAAELNAQLARAEIFQPPRA